VTRHLNCFHLQANFDYWVLYFGLNANCNSSPMEHILIFSTSNNRKWSFQYQQLLEHLPGTSQSNPHLSRCRSDIKKKSRLTTASLLQIFPFRIFWWLLRHHFFSQ
jgi:hypothetical protein